MKVARWVREWTVGKGLSSGNHLAGQAGRNSISTSLAVYFMCALEPQWPLLPVGVSSLEQRE